MPLANGTESASAVVECAFDVVCWSSHRLAGWMDGSLAGWLAGWLVGRRVGELGCALVRLSRNASTAVGSCVRPTVCYWRITVRACLRRSAVQTAASLQCHSQQNSRVRPASGPNSGLAPGRAVGPVPELEVAAIIGQSDPNKDTASRARTVASPPSKWCA